MCIVSNDIKILVASSSVVHIRFCISSLIIISKVRVSSRIIIILGHGICSSCLFYFCNLFYSLFGRRRLTIRKGLVIISPSLIVR